MGDGSGLLEILLFAAIAGFLLLRLRSVLGRRTGTERRRDPFASPRGHFGGPGAPPPVRPTPAIAPVIEGTAVPVAPMPRTGVAAVAAADPSFSEGGFLQGARGAFEIIVNAFAAGDTAALKPLLSTDVYSRFEAAVRARVAARETMQTKLVAIKSATIAEASVEGTTALVTATLVSEQSNATLGADGKIVDGDPNQVSEHSDTWTFARSLRSRDPNWTLVATRSP